MIIFINAKYIWSLKSQVALQNWVWTIVSCDLLLYFTITNSSKFLFQLIILLLSSKAPNSMFSYFIPPIWGIIYFSFSSLTDDIFMHSLILIVSPCIFLAFLSSIPSVHQPRILLMSVFSNCIWSSILWRFKSWKLGQISLLQKLPLPLTNYRIWGNPPNFTCFSSSLYKM